jgi:N-acetylated-alpha-linked acidic dipeptidase
MQKAGWRPRRTIKLALWDAEEFGLIGSTEWVEKHQDELAAKAVVYFNSDTNGKGFFNAGGSPALQVFFSQVLRDVTAPGSKKPLIEVRPEKDGKPQPFRLGPLGAGSDYVAFIHHAGIASINSAFSGVDAGGVYHSIYDSLHWYTNFSDGDFSHGKAFAQVMTTAITRMAGSQVLPFEFGNVISSVEEWMKDKDLPKVDLKEVHAELERLKTASSAYEAALEKGAPTAAVNQAAVNQALIRTERALTLPAGLPGRPWYKHQLMAPGLYTGYSAKTLPAIRDSKDPAGGVKLVASALRAYVSAIDNATRLLRQ